MRWKGRHVDVTPPRRVENFREGWRNRGSGRDHTALCLGAAYANGLAVRQGHSEGSSRNLAAAPC
jgi:hypothetical protein